MDQPLAVVIGAGPGIGAAAARRFLAEGCRVAAVVRPGMDLDLPPACLQVRADLAREGVLAPALAAVEAWGGLPSLVVYNASAGAPGRAEELPEARALADLRVNVLAPLEAGRWAARAMRELGGGTLVFTGGGLALAPKAGMASACLGKAALRSLALSFAHELEPEGIHAATLTVCGFVQPGTALSPDRVAEALWALHLQPRGAWDSEDVLP
ncbi:MAG TPA: SDR family NAD(P)-dependent oxidoreductase [Holophaga sp.]|nr:SDR family NAD(P)-dependent oxidoreductase [Holophaga sp.]